MKNTIYRSILCVAMVAAMTSLPTRAANTDGIVFGVTLGAAIPDANMATAYDLVRRADDPFTLYDAVSSIGLHAGGRVRIGLTPNVSLLGGIDVNRFFDGEQRITLQSGDVVVLSSATDIIPIHAGLQAFLGRWIVAPYVSGSVTYSYRRVTVSEVGRNSTIADILLDRGIDLEPSSARFGGRIAAGVAFELGPFHPFVELGYTASNIIGRSVDEPRRSFVQIVAGLTF